MSPKIICLKCGKEGVQYYQQKDDSTYLFYYHPKILENGVIIKRRICYVGRVRVFGETLSQFNKPKTKEEYEKAMTKLASQIKRLIYDYQGMNQGSVRKITETLKGFLMDCGYWEIRPSRSSSRFAPIAPRKESPHLRV